MPVADPYDVLDDLYDQWVAEYTEDIPFWRACGRAAREARATHEPAATGTEPDVAVFGAGSGRVAIPLARDGYRVTALDRSAAQLQRLAALLRADPVQPPGSVTAVHGDLLDAAELLGKASADLVVIPFRTLLHVAERGAEALAAAASVVRPGGLVAFDLFHLPVHDSSDRLTTLSNEWMHRVTTDPDGDGSRWELHERGQVDPDGETFVMEVWARQRGSDTRYTGAERIAEMRLTAPPVSWWIATIAAAGLTIVESRESPDGEPLLADSPTSFWVCSRDPDHEPHAV